MSVLKAPIEPPNLRTFFKAPKSANSANIFLSCAQKFKVASVSKLALSFRGLHEGGPYTFPWKKRPEPTDVRSISFVSVFGEIPCTFAYVGTCAKLFSERFHTFSCTLLFAVQTRIARLRHKAQSCKTRLDKPILNLRSLF